MNRREILERERRLAPYAATCAILVPVLFIASTAIRGAISFPDGLPTDQLPLVDLNHGPLLASSILQALSFGLMAVPLFYLFRAAQARSERVIGLMVGFAVIGPAAFAAQMVLSYAASTQLASDFLAQASSGGDIYTVFDDLRDDSSLLISSSIVAQLGFFTLIVAMIYTPLQAMRVGLLTRFFATLGMALGVITFLLPVDLLQPALPLWFGWLGFLILGRVPGGRPPAWEAGDAIPWPRPGEEPEAAPDAARAEGNGVVEGDAEEIVSPTPKDHSARRERARKRKRKRRG
jgi:hypothetical protein